MKILAIKNSSSILQFDEIFQAKNAFKEDKWMERMDVGRSQGEGILNLKNKA
jgi:hypothetical protein